ncbi:hypothetical protein LTR70_008915 [Exophiala xenobiotica]|uniref:Uncharacterized protein n=1 Tax=Lithohypha guttulata TaxID=1690604 RepID=A0ABR0JZD2_9EURO|nr:hypothetical protein LTR24_008635 [Lithohypha guttulata]KAK5311238.1 hypothetical protein LTR70_008915 [Exophiala xenobiotica]
MRRDGMHPANKRLGLRHARRRELFLHQPPCTRQTVTTRVIPLAQAFLTLLAQSATTPVEGFAPTVALEDVQTSFSAPLADERSPTLEQQEHSRRALRGHLRHVADLKRIVATVVHPADRLQDLISVESNKIIELEAAIRQSTDFSKVALPIIRPTIEKLLSEYRDELQLVKLRDQTLNRAHAKLKRDFNFMGFWRNRRRLIEELALRVRQLHEAYTSSSRGIRTALLAERHKISKRIDAVVEEDEEIVRLLL